MDRINKIITNQNYQLYYERIQKLEKNRIFCCHTLEHFLDVARLTYIMALEKNIPVNREIVYAAGLLHDIGRFCQYETGEPHEIASARLALEILKESRFTEPEIKEIQELILSHRDYAMASDSLLGSCFYKADKLSRNCFSCQAEKDCDWPLEKKNISIIY